MQNRLIWLDNLKGFLIILVVLGHAIQCVNPDFQHDILFRYIYSFHMPLFIFVSGYACYRNYIGWEMIKKRFTQLMVPYTVWSLIICITQGHLRLWEMFVFPERSLWFLYVLFFITVVHVLCVEVSGKFGLKEELVVPVVAIGLFASMIFFHSFGYPIIAKYFFYYCFGFYLRKCFSFKISRLFMCYGVLVVFMIMAFFCMQDSVPSFMPTGSSKLYKCSYNTIVALTGIMSFMLLFANKVDKVWPAITKWGGVTLSIYAIHRSVGMFLIYKMSSIIGFDISDLTTIQYYFAIFIVFVFLLVLSLLLNFLLEKYHYTRIAFLGKR